MRTIAICCLLGHFYSLPGECRRTAFYSLPRIICQQRFIERCPERDWGRYQGISPGFGAEQSVRFNKILDVHHFHIKAIASEDNELLRLFMDYLPFETNKGIRSFGSIHSSNNTIYYTRNLEDFRQVRRIAGAQGRLVVNAAYTFDETLLKNISGLIKNCL